MKTAAAFAAPIPTGMNGCAFQVRVLRPGRVPAYTDPAQMAANPSLAVLSVAYHGRDPVVANAFVAGMANWPVYSPFAKLHYGKGLQKGTEQGIEQGIEQGERDAIFEVLRARGLTPTEAEADRINASASLDQIKAWLRKSVTVAKVRELFD